MSEDTEEFELVEVDFQKSKGFGKSSTIHTSGSSLYDEVYGQKSGFSTMRFWIIGVALIVIGYILNYVKPDIYSDTFAYWFSVAIMILMSSVSIYARRDLDKQSIRIAQRLAIPIASMFLFDLAYEVNLWDLLGVTISDNLIAQFILDFAVGLGLISLFLIGEAIIIWGNEDYTPAEKAAKLVMPMSVMVIAVILPIVLTEEPLIVTGAMNPGDRMNAIFAMLFTSNMAIVNIAFILLGTIATIASINRKSAQTFVSVAQMTMAGVPAIVTALILTGTILPPEDFVLIFTESMDPGASAPLAIIGLIWALANTSVWVIVLSIMSVFIDGARVLQTQYGD